MRALPVLALLSLVAFGNAARADDASLYRATVFVTGQQEPERLIGFAQAFGFVLAKVSGNPALIKDAAIAAMARTAATFIDTYSYRDLMAGIPVHDEQGTRQRPYELTVDFVPTKIDAALATIGETPWAGPRPRLVVIAGVRNGDLRYVLASDGTRGRDQRDSLAAAAERFGMPVVVPDTAALSAAGVTFELLNGTAIPDLTPIVSADGGDVAVTGTLDWSDAALGWTAHWSMTWHGKTQRWQVSGVNFDDAFRSTVSGAEAIASGKGSPD